MGAITISFIHDPETKRHELWVDYESAEDWLPAEHERRHRQIVRQLLSDGQLSPDQVDRINIRVEGKEVESEDWDDVKANTAQPEKA